MGSMGQLDFGSEMRRRADRLLVADEVALMLCVTRSWVYAETRAGRLPCVRLGRYYRYRESAIVDWIAEHES